MQLHIFVLFGRDTTYYLLSFLSLFSTGYCKEGISYEP